LNALQKQPFCGPREPVDHSLNRRKLKMKTIIAVATMLVVTFAFGLAYAGSDELPGMYPAAAQGSVVHEAVQQPINAWTAYGNDELPFFATAASEDAGMTEATGSAAGGVTGLSVTSGVNGANAGNLDLLIGGIGSDLP
jgi:hypothetical protein